MTSFTRAGFSGLCVLFMGTTALHADVTSQQVWDAWNKIYTSYGYQISSGDTTVSGSTLVVSDLTMTNTMEGSSVEMTIPELRLRELGDGTVKVTASKQITAKATSAVKDASPVNMDIKITQADAVAIVSGTPEAMSYDVTAPEVVVELDQVASRDGKDVPVKLWMSASGISGNYVVAEDADRKMTSDFDISGVKFTVTGADPQSGTTFDLGGSLVDVNAKSDATMPEGVDMKNFGDALAKGMDVSAALTYGASSYTMQTNTAKDGPTSLKWNAQSGRFDMKLNGEAARYSASEQKSTLEVQTAQLPMPLSATLSSSEFKLSLPLAAADMPRPFEAKVGLVNLAPSEELWGLLDPQGHLAHDPATLVIDLSGTATPIVDLFSPEAAQSKLPPIQIDSLDINRVNLNVAGGDLSGTGALTFDNTMGMPMPVGAIDLTLSGANKVMDGLVAMGLMPQDQVMFARMMLGLYAVPAGDDLMTSKIEFKDGGEILANGQRIK